MKYFSLDLVAESPLAIRADHAPGGAATASYIAGSTLAGSLAAAHRLFYAEQAGDFERLFLAGQIQYPHLYPATFKQKAAQQALQLPVYPLPRTARSCKRFPGFEHDKADDQPHGVLDCLFDWATFELGKQTHDSLVLLIDHKKCEKCGKAMNHHAGFYRQMESELAEARMFEAKVETRLQTHTGIDRSTGTVQEGILYSRQVFEEQTRFSGVVKLSDELARPFENFIGQVGKSGLVRVGTGRTRGLGRVQLSALALKDESFGMTSFERRVEAFDRALRERVREACKNIVPQPIFDSFYFALTLHSPAILRDPLLRYRGSINEEALHELTGLPVDSLKLIYQTTDIKRVTGWNDLWDTPRESEYALETGSVFLFAFKAETSEALYQALFRLEEAGIGQRRAEGFGRVCISDPFHLEEKLR